MCLIAFAFGAGAGSGVSLRLASNRDEFFSRPTEPAHWWPEAREVFAGRDLQAGGTWLAASRHGRVGAITNHRNGLPAQAPRSRGSLVADFVHGHEQAGVYAERIAHQCADYGGFNLLLFELLPQPIAWYVNDLGQRHQLRAGLYGISNARLDTPWRKVERLKEALARSLGQEQAADAPADAPAWQPDPELRPDDELFEALLDRSVDPEYLLPDSGVGIERERYLSPAFISPTAASDIFGGYGTRASTIIEAREDGRLRFVERSWNTPGAPAAGYRERDESFVLLRT